MKTENNLEKLVYRMNQLRGVFAVLIVIGHCSGHFEREWLPFYLIHKFNMVGVCFFLFISGLSMTYHFSHDSNYLNHFIKNKVIFLIIVALLSRIVGLVLKMLSGITCSWNASLVIDWNWYINEMLFFYVAFYVSFRAIPFKTCREIFLLTLTIILFFITIYFFRYGEWRGWQKEYFISCFSFVYGTFFGEYYECLEKIFCRKKGICCSVLFLVSLLCCYSIKLPDDSFVGGG